MLSPGDQPPRAGFGGSGDLSDIGRLVGSRQRFLRRRAASSAANSMERNPLGGSQRPSAVRTVPRAGPSACRSRAHGRAGCYNVGRVEPSHAARRDYHRAERWFGNIPPVGRFLDVGGLGVLRRGHQPHRRGPIGRRRAGRLGRGAAVRPAKVALLFRRPLAPLAGSPGGRGSVGNFGVAHARERSASSRSA